VTKEENCKRVRRLVSNQVSDDFNLDIGYVMPGWSDIDPEMHGYKLYIYSKNGPYADGMMLGDPIPSNEDIIKGVDVIMANLRKAMMEYQGALTAVSMNKFLEEAERRGDI